MATCNDCLYHETCHGRIAYCMDIDEATGKEILDIEKRCKDFKNKADFVEVPESGIGDLSDGYHTFNELYHHRAVLFSVICNSMSDKAWKSKLHDTGDMFDGMFIVGIETPDGQATYHYDINPYWDMFKVKELEKAPRWDGHTPTDAINRIANITTKAEEVKHGYWINHYSDIFPADYTQECSICHKEEGGNLWNDNYCPNCGARMDGRSET